MKQFNFAKSSIQKILLIGGIVVLAFSCSTDMESAEKVLADAANAANSSSSLANVNQATIAGSITANAHAYSSSSIYYIGETPEYQSDITVTTKAEYCGEVVYEENLIGTALTAAHAGQTVKVVAKCSKSGQELSAFSAKVVPDQSLSGTCSWSKNPTTAAKGAVPRNVTLHNSYGRCGSFADGTLPPSAYSGSDGVPWPADGLVAAGTYGVETNLTCVPTANCPALTVNENSEYVITCTNGLNGGDCVGSNEVLLKVDECVDINVEWTNNFNIPGSNPRMGCGPINGSSTGVSFTLVLKGVQRPEVFGYWTEFLLDKITLGHNELGPLCLKTLVGADEVRCQPSL